MSSKFTKTETTLADIMKLLSHPARVKIIEILSQQAACIPKDIFAEIPLSRGTINQHIAVLKEANWIQITHKGSQPFYCINSEKYHSDLQLISDFISSQSSLPTISCVTTENCCSNYTSQKILFIGDNESDAIYAEQLFNELNNNKNYTAISSFIDSSDKHKQSEYNTDTDVIQNRQASEVLLDDTISIVIYLTESAQNNYPILFVHIQNRLSFHIATDNKKKEIKNKIIQLITEL